MGGVNLFFVVVVVVIVVVVVVVVYSRPILSYKSKHGMKTVCVLTRSCMCLYA